MTLAAGAGSGFEQARPLVGTLMAMAGKDEERAIPWAAPPHTLAKLEIFRQYLGGWFPIHAFSHSKHRRLIVFDGFSGPGEYLQPDGTRPDGSPAVALKTFINHTSAPKMGKVEGVFVFTDSDPRCVEHLKKNVLPGIAQPPNVLVHTDDREFHVVANEILDRVGEKGLAPTFAFVDPFGWKGVHMSVVARILGFRRAEVLVNLNVNRLNQFITTPDQKIFADLFGTDERPNVMAGGDRYDIISDFYTEQLRQHAEFVWPFRMLDDRGRPIYDLVFATNNIAGLQLMKDAMWSLDPVAGARFSDRSTAQTSLFGNEPDLRPLRQALKDRFGGGKEISIQAVERFVLTDTAYKLGHLKTKTLKPMEQAGELEYAEGWVKRKRAFTYPEGCFLRFS